MTAPDPRVGEIEARLAAATPGPWETTQAADEESTTWIEAANGDVLHHDERGYGHMRENFAWMKRADAEFIAAAPADVSYLLAELRKAHEALARVEGFLDNDEDKLYAAICRNTCGKDIYGVDHEAIATTIAEDIRAAVAAANGDGQ